MLHIHQMAAAGRRTRTAPVFLRQLHLRLRRPESAALGPAPGPRFRLPGLLSAASPELWFWGPGREQWADFRRPGRAAFL